jgi:hypothetical protein
MSEHSHNPDFDKAFEYHGGGFVLPAIALPGVPHAGDVTETIEGMGRPVFEVSVLAGRGHLRPPVRILMKCPRSKDGLGQELDAVIWAKNLIHHRAEDLGDVRQLAFNAAWRLGAPWVEQTLHLTSGGVDRARWMADFLGAKTEFPTGGDSGVALASNCGQHGWFNWHFRPLGTVGIQMGINTYNEHLKHDLTLDCNGRRTLPLPERISMPPMGVGGTFRTFLKHN